MKKLFILIGIGCSIGSLRAYHMDLNSQTKCAFAKKRLDMTKTHLRSTQQELALLEGSLASLPDHELEHFPVRKTRIAELKKEVLELESSIPIMEKSLQALCETIK